jgi:hypothetical protein
VSGDYATFNSNPYRQKIETAEKTGILSNPGVAAPELIR